MSLPSAAGKAMFSLGILALSGFAFRLGTNASAAHQIVNQVESFSFLPCIGFSGAASALVGQGLGMGDPGRAPRSGWAAVRMSILWSTLAGLAFMVLPQALLGSSGTTSMSLTPASARWRSSASPSPLMR